MLYTLNHDGGTRVTATYGHSRTIPRAELPQNLRGGAGSEGALDNSTSMGP